MLASSIPTKIPVPFASNASGSFVRPIPIPSQIATDPGAASFTDGFPPLNGTPIAAGGIPPDERDMNGILLAITQWNQWANAGGPVPYDGTFQTAVGGYPNGAIIQSAIVPGKQWQSLVDNNMSNPDALGAGWSTPVGQLPTGTPIPSFSGTVLPGYVLANGLRIGDAASGSDGLASPQAFFLFCFIWNNFPQSECPVQVGGGTVARGANAIADWTANRQITTPLMQGTSLVGADANGTARLAGVPVGVGGTTTPGSLLGENLHTLAVSEVPALSYSGSTVTGVENQSHSHVYNQASATAVGQVTTGSLSGSIQQIPTSSGTESANHNHNYSWSGVTNGGGGSHNNVPLSYLVRWNLML